MQRRRCDLPVAALSETVLFGTGTLDNHARPADLESVLWLSIVIDNACTGIWEAWRSGAQLTSLRVSPAVYRAVAAARPGEVAGDCPLMLLGLPLIADPSVASYEPVVG